MFHLYIYIQVQNDLFISLFIIIIFNFFVGLD